LRELAGSIVDWIRSHARGYKNMVNRVYTILVISELAEQLLASRETHYTVDLVDFETKTNITISDTFAH
jgi:hypothetical protein